MKFIYLLGVIYFSITWMVLFGLFHRERKAIVWSSFAWGPAGPLSEYLHRADYWRPDLILAIHIGNWTFGLEDYFFAFAFGGICTGIFELLIRRFWQAEDIRSDWKGFVKLFGIVMFSLMLMGALSWLFSLNSLTAINISFILIAGSIFCNRPTLIFAGIITAIIIMCFMWLFYWGFFLRIYPDIIEKWWLSSTLSGITVAKVPIEELLWAGSAALLIGPSVRYSLLTSKG